MEAQHPVNAITHCGGSAENKRACDTRRCGRPGGMTMAL
jgi:hypothetical protein